MMEKLKASSADSFKDLANENTGSASALARLTYPAAARER